MERPPLRRCNRSLLWCPDWPMLQWRYGRMPTQTHAATRHTSQLVSPERSGTSNGQTVALILSFTPRSGDPTVDASQSECSFLVFFFGGFRSIHLASSLAGGPAGPPSCGCSPSPCPCWPLVCAASEKNIFARAARHFRHSLSLHHQTVLRHFVLLLLFPCANFVLYSSLGQLVSPFPFPCFITTYKTPTFLILDE